MFNKFRTFNTMHIGKKYKSNYRSIACLIFLIILFTNCRKESELARINNAIQGDWQFTHAIGGLTGNHIIYPDVPTKLSFKSSTSYTIEKDGVVTEQGTFSLKYIPTIFDNELSPSITFSSSDYPKLIAVTDSSLIISDNHVEPYSYMYVRWGSGINPP